MRACRGALGREIEPVDDFEWADRCQYWANYRPRRPGRRKKYRFREPLILAGHGIGIRVHRNTLLIRPGRTHYPQKTEEIRFFPGDPNLPDRIIILDASGGITLDALSWMSEQEIALVQLNWRGQVSFSGNCGFSADPKLVRLQCELQGSKMAMQINRRLIAAKFDASGQTLRAIFGDTPSAKDAISKIQSWKMKVQNSTDANSHGRILGYEGMAASIYYRAWHDLPLKWSGLWKKPVPPSWSKIGARSMAWQRESNNARHPINAMLNYGYAMLISQVRSELVAAGFDPSIGFAHRREGNRIPLVYDLMEPLRPVVDQKILEFSLSHTFTPGDFTISSGGGCRLNPQMARVVAERTSTVGAEHIRVLIGLLRLWTAEESRS
jgi:CRISPR-associated protein Cas1